MEYLPNELKINLSNLDKATYIKLLELADAVIIWRRKSNNLLVLF
jgi:hypothetical protein